jgi:hypothetical protein
MTPFEDFLTGQRLAGPDALPTKPGHGSEAGIGRQTLEMAENSPGQTGSFDVWTRGGIAKTELQ